MVENFHVFKKEPDDRDLLIITESGKIKELQYYLRNEVQILSESRLNYCPKT